MVRIVLISFALVLLQTAAIAQEQPLRIDVKNPPEGIIPPKPLPSKQPIRYPAVAMRCSAEGAADVELTVLPSGDVADPKLASSTGYGVLDDASMDYARSLHYSPATKDGLPIAVRIRTLVNWRLAGGPHAVLQTCLKALRAVEPAQR